jgi:hypothetical protein
MSIRRRNDSVKPGCGIDGDLGSNYTKQHRTDPWDSNPKGNDVGARGAGKYEDKEVSFLRNRPADDQTGGAGSKDILDNVERNSGTGKPGAIRYGID